MRIKHTLPALLTLIAVAACGPTGHAQTDDPPTVDTQPLEPRSYKITLDDMPPPYATDSASQQPKEIAPPDDAVLHAPEGFVVNVFAHDIKQARWLTITPEGDVLCSAGRDNKIHLLRDTDNDGRADESHVIYDEDLGAKQPFGMAFLPIDAANTTDDTDNDNANKPADHYLYIANTDGVRRWHWQLDDNHSLPGRGEKITDLPGEGYHQHWTRNVVVAPDHQWLYVSVGSKSNADIEESPRASVLRMKPDGSERSVFVSGTRNPVGLDFHPTTGALFTAVNERDGLGDSLVPDYLTHIQEGEFYGWPYVYFAPRFVDPRHEKDGRSIRPELAATTQTPQVLFESHSAALGLAFYDADQFPEQYRNSAFVVFRGSWNRSRGTGYKVVHVPFDNGEPTGGYEDFVTGFLIDPQGPTTWGRPVGIAVAADGSLLFTEESNGRIYRVSYQAD